MKRYKVVVETSDRRYCHITVTANDDSPEQIKIAENKAIKEANDTLSYYKEKEIYCFIYICDNEHNIIYENDNVSYIEKGKDNKGKGDQITLDEIVHINRDLLTCSCQIASGSTAENNNKFIRFNAELCKGFPTTYYTVYVCDPGMCHHIGKEFKTHSLNIAIEKYNSL